MEHTKGPLSETLMLTVAGKEMDVVELVSRYLSLLEAAEKMLRAYDSPVRGERSIKEREGIRNRLRSAIEKAKP